MRVEYRKKQPVTIYAHSQGAASEWQIAQAGNVGNKAQNIIQLTQYK
jgi:hypothetical protein